MGYNATEAARLVSWAGGQSGLERLSGEQLRDWVDSGVGLLTWGDIWEGEKYIDFPTLISLRLIFRLHSHGVPLEAITEAAPRLRRELGVEWPFASKRMWDYDVQVVDPEESEALEHIAKGLVLCSEKLTLSGLEFDEDGVACAWRPVRDVVIYPDVVTGSPCIAGTRVPTRAMWDMASGGDSIETLVYHYHLSEDRVRSAIEWEDQLAAVRV